MSSSPPPADMTPGDAVGLRPGELGKVPDDRPVLAPGDLADRDQRLAVYLEHKITSVIRRESRDPYAGLPADDVLDRLDRRFPQVGFPERMMRRLELEQQHRYELSKQTQETERYEAETDREATAGEQLLARQAGRRALIALLILVAVGLLCIFTGHERAGEIVLGTTVVGVVGSFVVNQTKGKK